VQDFTVPSPHRIVLDLTGATLAPLARAYDRIPRGGISNIRMSQYRTDVVRVVLDLDREREYSVTQDEGVIRISLESDAQFAAWHSTGRMLAEAERDIATTRTVEAAGTVESTPPAAEPGARVASDSGPTIEAIIAAQAQQPRITVTYSGADIRDVLAAFATFSQRTIVVGKDVTGTIPAEIKDQPWDVALKACSRRRGSRRSRTPPASSPSTATRTSSRSRRVSRSPRSW
jgi:type IV pilus assembly protein PilQ